MLNKYYSLSRWHIQSSCKGDNIQNKTLIIPSYTLELNRVKQNGAKKEEKNINIETFINIYHYPWLYLS